MLNIVGERTPLCGTQVLNCHCEDVSCIYAVKSGFASLHVVYEELNDCAWNLGM